jgi:N utilization substance protein B
MSKSKARENAFLLIFERVVTGEYNEYSLNLFKEKNAADADYIEKIYNGVDKNIGLLRFCVSRFATGFKPERIFKADYGVLLLSAYEILFTDIPFKAAVNEALELSKKYSTPKSAAFINGVLARVIERKDKILSGEEQADELREIEAAKRAKEESDKKAGEETAKNG